MYISTFFLPLLNTGSSNFVEGTALKEDKQECSGDLRYTFIYSLKYVTSDLSRSHRSDAVSSSSTGKI